MITPDGFVQARLWGWGVILACVEVPVAIAFLVLTLVNMQYQSADIAVLVAAANRTMPGVELGPLLTALAESSRASGIVSIVVVVLVVCAGIIILLATQASLDKSIRMDHAPALASCRSRLEMFQKLRKLFADTHVTSIIEQSGEFRAEASPDAAWMRAEVEACLDLIRKIEVAQGSFIAG